MYECTKDRFLKSVKNHKIKVLQNDGVYRHIRCAKPGTVIDSFSLTTWPGFLCIAGDMGDYLFSRLDDMFNFFRSREMKINPVYEHEKLRAGSRFEPAKKFSRELLREIVRDEFRDGRRNGEITNKNKHEIWRELSWIRNAENEADAISAAENFECCGFTLLDFYENELREFTYHFIWCLYAITWGINQFDRMEG